jgi:hypothetical protein
MEDRNKYLTFLSEAGREVENKVNLRKCELGSASEVNEVEQGSRHLESVLFGARLEQPID